MTSLDPRLPQDGPLRPWLLRGALVVALVAGIAIYVARNPDAIGEARVALEIRADKAVALGSGPEVPLAVSITLVNRTELDADLRAPNACAVLRWLLLTEEGAFVQSKLPEEDCPQVSLAAVLAAGGEERQELTLALDRRRLVPGRYVLKMQFWGHEAEHRLIVRE